MLVNLIKFILLILVLVPTVSAQELSDDTTTSVKEEIVKSKKAKPDSEIGIILGARVDESDRLSFSPSVSLNILYNFTPEMAMRIEVGISENNGGSFVNRKFFPEDTRFAYFSLLSRAKALGKHISPFMEIGFNLSWERPTIGQQFVKRKFGSKYGIGFEFNFFGPLKLDLMLNQTIQNRDGFNGNPIVVEMMLRLTD